MFFCIISDGCVIYKVVLMVVVLVREKYLIVDELK